MHSIVVEAHASGQRLDKVLAHAGLGRRQAHALCKARRVMVDGRPRAADYSVRAGQQISWSLPTSEKKEIDLELVYEDQSLVVVNKAPFVHAHSIKRNPEPTLADQLLVRFPEMRGIGYSAPEAGLIHRLDYETSGLLIAARTRESFLRLCQMMKGGLMSKYYFSLVSGPVAAPQLIEQPLMNHPRTAKKVVIVNPEKTHRGRVFPAKTMIEEALQQDAWSLLKLKVTQAHRHQIRVHLASLGHPIVADRLYGGEALAFLQRQFLHAGALCFKHPSREHLLELSAPLAPDLCQALQALNFKKEAIARFVQ